VAARFSGTVVTIYQTKEQVASVVILLATCLLAGSCWNFLRPWRWRQYVPPKRRLHLNRLHAVTSQKMILFITTAVKTSNPTSIKLYGVTSGRVGPSDNTCIWELPASNLGQDIDHPDWGFAWFSSVAPRKCRNCTFNLASTASFHTFIIYSLSFTYSTLFSLSYR
jgi:hypothetical protein